jgi:hypothetical protein
MKRIIYKNVALNKALIEGANPCAKVRFNVSLTFVASWLGLVGDYNAYRMPRRPLDSKSECMKLHGYIVDVYQGCRVLDDL